MNRSCQRNQGTRRVWVAFMGALTLFSASGAWALSQRPMTLDEVIDASEHIFTAVCEGRQSRFHDGNVYTTYKLRPVEEWKGRLAVNESGVIEMEEVGGSVEGQVLVQNIPGASPDATAPPVKLNQFVGGSANIVTGEEVLLFAQTAKPVPQLAQRGMASPFKAGNLQIVGRTFGRFSVLTDPATGEKLVTRVNVEAKGVIPNEAAVRGFLNVQQRQLEARAAAGADAGAGLPVDAVMKAVQSGEDAKAAKIQAGRAKAQAASAKAISTLKGEVSDFDTLSSVKDRVSGRLSAKAAK